MSFNHPFVGSQPVFITPGQIKMGEEGSVSKSGFSRV
jgi:hypothetical protein